MFKRLFVWALLAVCLFAGYQWLTFPDVARLATDSPETTAFMERRREELRDKGESDVIEYRWVPYNRVSSYLRRAVLVAEDDSFYEHEGVDVEGIKVALRKNWEKKKVTRGGSTITQQLAKNLYLSPTRSPLRKVKEYLIARELERKLTKKRILELYLNVVEYGERVYGAEAAARHYFRKPASALTASEAALLAGSLPNPRVMNPSKPNKRLRSRQKMILSRMRRWGHLAEREVLTERKKKKEPANEPSPAEEPVDATAATDTTVTETNGIDPVVSETAGTAASEVPLPDVPSEKQVEEPEESPTPET